MMTGEDQIELKRMALKIDVFFKHGLPALVQVVQQLSSNELVSREDIEALKTMIPAENYFEK